VHVSESEFPSFLVGHGNDNRNAGVMSMPSPKASQNTYRVVCSCNRFTAALKPTLNLRVRLELHGNLSERFNRLLDCLPDDTGRLSSANTSVTNAVTGHPLATINWARTPAEALCGFFCSNLNRLSNRKRHFRNPIFPIRLPRVSRTSQLWLCLLTARSITVQFLLQGSSSRIISGIEGPFAFVKLLVQLRRSCLDHDS